MRTAPSTAGLSSQPRQTGGAWLVRRLGGAVRGAIAGISRFARCRPAMPRRRRQLGPDPVTRCLDEACPELSRGPAGVVSHQPRVAPSPPRRRSRRRADTRFTPLAYPELSPAACAILNTPLEECDPAVLEVLSSAFIQYLEQMLPQEPDAGDSGELMSGLWGRLNAALAAASPDAAPPDEAAAAAVEAVPDSVARHQSDGDGRDLEVRPVPAFRRSAPLFARVCRRQCRVCRGHCRGCRPALRRRPGAEPHRPPTRRLCYAACAGPG